MIEKEEKKNTAKTRTEAKLDEAKSRVEQLPDEIFLPETFEETRDGTKVPSHKTETIVQDDFDDEEDLLIDLEMNSQEKKSDQDRFQNLEWIENRRLYLQMQEEKMIRENEQKEGDRFSKCFVYI